MTEHKKRFDRIMDKLEEKAGAEVANDGALEQFNALDEKARSMVICRALQIGLLQREIANVLAGRGPNDCGADHGSGAFPEDGISEGDTEGLHAGAVQAVGEQKKRIPAIRFKGPGDFCCFKCGEGWNYTGDYLIYIDGREICPGCGRKVAPELQRLIDTPCELPPSTPRS